MNEIISGIQVIKMYTWERPFAKLVEYARRSVFFSILKATRVTVYVTVVAYVLLGNRISAEKVKSHNPPLLSHQKFHI
jgi:ATP-binding cassette, subfamily C (CFTR/MRP), member 4